MNNEHQANKFLQWIGKNYDKQKAKFETFCKNKLYNFDEDLFSETYLKVYERIRKMGIQDDSDNGFDNYFFKAFKINLLREEQYARNQKRDSNIQDIGNLYEQWYNYTNRTQYEKLLTDLKKDFSVLYLLLRAEEHFPNEYLYLFKLKTFEPHMTYKKLYDKTKIKGCRQKVLEVKNWLKENVTKEEIDKSFIDFYGNEFFN